VHGKNPGTSREKWKNFIAAARLAIRKFNNGLTETGNHF
jgi:hypothetical protein